VKGLGRGGQHQQQEPALGEEGDFAVDAGVYGKVQAEPNVKPNDQGRRKGRERCLLLALAGLSGYLCRVCPMCVGSSRLGGGVHATTIGWGCGLSLIRLLVCHPCVILAPSPLLI
jgi:hypothetical protein